MLNIAPSILALDGYAPAVLVGTLLQKLQVVATDTRLPNTEDRVIQLLGTKTGRDLASRLLASTEEIQGRRRPVESFIKLCLGFKVYAKWLAARLE
jgi:hypothetical protein